MQRVGLNRFGSYQCCSSGLPVVDKSRTIIACLLFFLLAIGLQAGETTSDQNSCQHELWIINTRCVPCCGCALADVSDFDFQRYGCDTGWETSDSAAFYKDTKKTVPTCFFIHGNQLSHCEAVSQGWSLYRLLSDAAGERPFRMVIWSWPTTRIQGRIRHDVQVKAARSDTQAYYLARCVDGMPVDTRIAMVGHSFGARVITGSLELLAGGSVACNALETTVKRPDRSVRAVLVAAAVDNSCLLPGYRNGQALQEVDRMLVTCNGCDRVLRWYPFLYGRGGPEAMGYTGPCLSQLGEDRQKVDVLGVSCSVGRGHGWYDYLCSCSLRSHLPWYAFLESDQTHEKQEKNNAQDEPVAVQAE